MAAGGSDDKAYHNYLHRGQNNQGNMAAGGSDDKDYHNDLNKSQNDQVSPNNTFNNHLSRGLYDLACGIIGDENIVSMRRQLIELMEVMHFMNCQSKNCSCGCLSGSIAEGFRFASSDWDYMFICRNAEIIHSLENIGPNQNDKTILLMECDKTAPGFVLLKLINETNDADIALSLSTYPSNTYVSSQIWREESRFRKQHEKVHGPCLSGVTYGEEYDNAYCFHSRRWPDAGHGFIKRVLRCKWPPLEVLGDIVAGGIDFVPISSKQSRFEFVEWRMSFSVAEKKLIHAMNHTQLMCYGLLKIFLKEAININKEIDSILCSYYFKTAVFWESMSPSLNWCPLNLLSCFWRCFRKIISWVQEEYLPNFFIPENNMLIGKFEPGQKIVLMDHLSMLHSEGYACLMRCPSLSRGITMIIEIPLDFYAMSWNNHVYKKCNRDIELVLEVWNWNGISVGSLQEQLFLSEISKKMLELHEDDTVKQVLLIWWKDGMTHLAVQFHASFFDNSSFGNKILYHINKTINNVIHRCRTDCVTHYIYIALCLYRCGRYRDVIKITSKALTVLQQPI